VKNWLERVELSMERVCYLHGQVNLLYNSNVYYTIKYSITAQSENMRGTKQDASFSFFSLPVVHRMGTSHLIDKTILV
jgi:hypothetical protein